MKKNILFILFIFLSFNLFATNYDFIYVNGSDTKYNVYIPIINTNDSGPDGLYLGDSLILRVGIGLSSNDGLSPDYPVASWAQAITKITSDSQTIVLFDSGTAYKMTAQFAPTRPIKVLSNLASIECSDVASIINWNSCKFLQIYKTKLYFSGSSQNYNFSGTEKAFINYNEFYNMNVALISIYFNGGIGHQFKNNYCYNLKGAAFIRSYDDLNDISNNIIDSCLSTTQDFFGNSGGNNTIQNNYISNCKIDNNFIANYNATYHKNNYFYNTTITGSNNGCTAAGNNLYVVNNDTYLISIGDTAGFTSDGLKAYLIYNSQNDSSLVFGLKKSNIRTPFDSGFLSYNYNRITSKDTIAYNLSDNTIYAYDSQYLILFNTNILDTKCNQIVYNQLYFDSRSVIGRGLSYITPIAVKKYLTVETSNPVTFNLQKPCKFANRATFEFSDDSSFVSITTSNVDGDTATTTTKSYTTNGIKWWRAKGVRKE